MTSADVEPSDRDVVRQVAIDYYEAWYDGDVGRIDGALHPDLVKRRAGEELGVTSKQRMLDLTAAGAGAEDAADRRLDVVVEDVHGDIASVTVRAAVYHEYLHLVRTGEGWKIANALWELS